MKCPTCGKEIGTSVSDERSLIENGECFSCSIWRERLSLVGRPDIAIIDGTFYTIGDENDPSPFRGFGGDKFVIKFKDGREVTTTNLWCGGNIDEHWKSQFPDNASFDWEWKKINNHEYLFSKEIPDELIAQAETQIGMQYEKYSNRHFGSRFSINANIQLMLTAKEAIFLARKYNLEWEVRQELASGATPEEALEEWDICQCYTFSQP